MPDEFRFSVLRLADVNRLHHEAHPLSGNRSMTESRQTIRQLLDLCSHQVWLAERLPAARIEVVFGFQLIDPVCRRAMLHLSAPAQPLSADILTAILHKAFFELDLFRLELAVAAENQTWLPVLESVGMIEEGRLRACQYQPDEKRHHDVMLYSMLRPESRIMNTAFIPFKLGFFTLIGDEQHLLSTSFIRYGSNPAPGILQEAAELFNLLGSTGSILSRQEWSKIMPDCQFAIHPQAPAFLRQAASQVASYFAGKLTHFSIPLDLSCGSRFQQQVWQALNEIPYGATWTYEELASRLIDADHWQEARKMARAVGSACGANPLPLILPCHRVIGKNGRLIGFSGGLDIKEYLLEHELMGVND